MIAVAAGDKAAQREIDMDVRARRRERFARNPFLNLMEGCKRYGRLMLPRTQRNVPRLTLHIASVDRVRHDAAGLLVRQVPVPRDRESGMRLEEAFDFRLRVEASAGIAFEAFLNN
ncbi:hypothetical protein DAH55_05920 [Sphingomonas koreensis]|uniref:hypothetical protein n=1 Tax=Sphingomonas koreensis TaxID=93064 RepID=UPI00082FBCEA|nr:hypothetical protein [Sphingomonas koreensis]RSU62369.1 hypothetical protein DAH56_03880 [Sphingomonas koreensis]RSU70080.1 hypothetical protein DAH55_05920 [Sphingomonas koreensis]